MDWLTFISAMSSAIAWPFVVLVIALVLREKIFALIPSLREVTMPLRRHRQPAFRLMPRRPRQSPLPSCVGRGRPNPR